MEQRFKVILWRFLFLALATFLLDPVNANAGEYYSITGPCGLRFPQDHGSHPGYRFEWWYYTGNLQAVGGERYGFQLTFFRVQMSPPGAERAWPKRSSAWRTQQLFLAHTALSDLSDKGFYYDDRMARGAVGLAGVESKGTDTRVFLGRWSAHVDPGRQHLQATTRHFALDLSLLPLKPPAYHGEGGYSLKGKRPESASCYYSFTRLKTSGTLTVKGRAIKVQGISWMDHEFSTAPLEKDLTGWDWFSIQLNNDTELMVYALRKEQGGYSPVSSGTFVESSGKAFKLLQKDFQMKILGHWTSPQTGALYPSRWQIRVPSIQMELLLVPNLADQELATPKTTNISYWEGSVSVSGSLTGQPIEGVGYVEMTGYDKPFNLME